MAQIPCSKCKDVVAARMAELSDAELALFAEKRDGDIPSKGKLYFVGYKERLHKLKMRKALQIVDGAGQRKMQTAKSMCLTGLLDVGLEFTRQPKIAKKTYHFFCNLCKEDVALVRKNSLQWAPWRVYVHM